MLFSVPIRSARYFCALAALALACLLALFAPPARAAGPRPGDPAIQIPLEPLGFLNPAARLIAQGSTLYTVHFVDDTHVLFTYYTRGLVERLPDTQPDDEDGNVAALLLELPTGKVLARTEWHVRDRDTYLWPLGHGRFLRRVRSRLTVLDPVRNLVGGDAFREEPFLQISRRIGYIIVSPMSDLLAIETVPPRKPKADAATLAAESSPPPRVGPEVEIFFYRLNVEQIAGQPERLHHQPAGALAAPNLIELPVDSDGFVSAVRDTPGVYNLDFHSHAGPTKELAAFDTTCSPRVHFVSRSEFVAFGCHGSPDKPELGGFNMKGEHPWIEMLPGNDLGRTVLASTSAGRFAISRVLVAGTVIDPRTIVPEEMQSQELTVRQAWSGKLLLKVQASPIQRAGQNFDLSPNGLSLVAVRNGSIDVFHLPLLTGKDESTLRELATSEPAANDALILLNSVPIRAEAAPVAKPAKPQPAAGSGIGAGSAAADAAPAKDLTPAPAGEALPGAVSQTEPAQPVNTNTVGDVPQQRRKPPTLFDADHPRGPDDPKPPKPTEPN